MAAPLVAITDGSAPALALVRWLASHGVRATVLEGRSGRDIELVALARYSLRSKERVVALSPEPDKADIDGSQALLTATTWLAGLAPIEQRGAAALVETKRVARESGHEAVSELLRLCKAGDLRMERGKHGRPKGTNPFAGVGADVLITMLAKPERSWTERQLATAVDRSPSAVHKVLAELRKRGYLEKRRGGTKLDKPLATRDDLLAAWRGKVAERAGQVLSCPRGQAPRHLVRQLQEEGHRILLAGVSAVQAPDGLMESIVTVYADKPALDALMSQGCETSIAGMGELAVWEPVERSVFYAPVSNDGVQATNRVVTYLDLAIGKSDRYQSAARNLWERPA